MKRHWRGEKRTDIMPDLAKTFIPPPARQNSLASPQAIDQYCTWPGSRCWPGQRPDAPGRQNRRHPGVRVGGLGAVRPIGEHDAGADSCHLCHLHRFDRGRSGSDWEDAGGWRRAGDGAADAGGERPGALSRGGGRHAHVRIHDKRWLPEAMEFVEVHRQELGRRPFAAFLVVMTLAMRHGETYRPFVAEFLAPVRALVTPVSVGLFAGALDLRQVPSRATGGCFA